LTPEQPSGPSGMTRLARDHQRPAAAAAAAAGDAVSDAAGRQGWDGSCHEGCWNEYRGVRHADGKHYCQQQHNTVVDVRPSLQLTWDSAI